MASWRFLAELRHVFKPQVLAKPSSSTRSSAPAAPRFSSGRSLFVARFSTSSNYSKDLDEINAKFAEAREEIELALESKETVYFNDEVETARAAVHQVLDKYETLISRLDPEDKGIVQRSMGLKMEQLKAEFAQLKD